MMQIFIKIVSIICIFGVLSVSFIPFSYAVDLYDNPAVIPLNQRSIIKWDHIGSGTVTENSTGSMRIVDSVGSSNVFYTTISGIVAGKTYILTGRMAFGQQIGNIKVGFAGTSNSDTIETFSSNNPTYWLIDDTTRDSYSSFSWSFVPRFTEVLGNNSLNYFISCEITQQKTTINLNIYNLEIHCLDDIVYNQLRSIVTETDDLEELVSQIIEEFQIHNDRMNTVNSNLTSIAQRITAIYQEIAPEFSEFEETYGKLFTVALYEVIREAFGLDQEPVEFETEPALASSVDNYKAAEEGLMVDYGQDLGNALSSGSGAASGNNAMQFIKLAMQELVLDNNKLAVFIMFALSFGLIVLVLGRRITR